MRVFLAILGGVISSLGIKYKLAKMILKIIFAEVQRVADKQKIEERNNLVSEFRALAAKHRAPKP